VSGASTLASAVEPLYFGAAMEPLFGMHHRPSGGPEREAAVVLCPPHGHEHIVSHPAYRQLASRLAAAGFHVLRFHFFGCGDSAGACEDGRPSRWLADITRAMGELRLRSGTSRIFLVGCRLGATLATLAGADRGDVRRLVLWDPVISGSNHAAELADRHRAMLRRSHVDPGRDPTMRAQDEVLGFAFPAGMRRELEAIDLLHLDRRPADHVLLIESRKESRELRQRLESLGTRVERRLLPTEDLWTWIEDVSFLVPHRILEAIVAWLSGGRP
jgi:uncharacterized protein